MSMSKVDWKSNAHLAVGKGATVQEFMAIVGETSLQLMSRRGAKAAYALTGKKLRI
jgi:hypothetical protein